MSSYVGEGEYRKGKPVEGEKKDFYEQKGGLVPKPENKELFEKKKYAVGELTDAQIRNLEDYVSGVMLVGV